MTYTAQSPLTEQGQASGPAITGWFQKRNVQAPPEIGQIITSESQAGNVNADIVAAQVAHETGFWASYAATHLNNPAGIGITNDLPRDEWPGFPTIQDGLHAQVAHLKTYIEGDANPWRAADPRFEATRSGDMFGRARVLQDLEQHWAWSPPADYAATPPNQRYAAGIASLANELVAFAADYADHFEGGQPMPTDDPEAQWMPSSNYDEGRGGVTIDRIVLHTTEGEYSGALSWLRGSKGGSNNRNSSTHYLIDRNGGRLVQLVREADTAWTVGNYSWNQRSINIEQEGYAGRGGFSDALYQAVGALVARIAARHGIPLDRAHVIGHSDVPNQDHTDPGPSYDFDKVLGFATPAPPLPDPCRRFPETGYDVCHGFRDHYEATLGERTLGLPRTPDFALPDPRNPGRTRNVQVFDKGVLIFLDEYEPENRVQRLNLDEPLFRDALRAAEEDYGWRT